MRRILVSAIALALAGMALDASAQDPAAVAPVVADATTQLPRDVRPTHYEVAVVPHADTLGFEGKATITLDVLEPTDRIVINGLMRARPGAPVTPVDGKIEPLLALSWRQVDDLTWEFKLRPDVKFHDGSPFNAEVAAANINRSQPGALIDGSGW